MCVGYLGEMIRSYVGDGERFGLDVMYSADGPVLLGTGGSLKKALPILGKEFFVLYGDSFLPIDFSPVEQAYIASGKAALMTVLKNGDCWDKSNVTYTGGQLLEYNKKTPKPCMSHIDYGLGVLSSAVLWDYTTEVIFDLADFYHELSLRRQLAGYEVQERFYEIGSLSGLAEAELYFLKKDWK